MPNKVRWGVLSTSDYAIKLTIPAMQKGECSEIRAIASREPGKAELIGGRIVRLMPTGRRPNRIAFQIARSLDDFAAQTGDARHEPAPLLARLAEEGRGFASLAEKKASS